MLAAAEGFWGLGAPAPGLRALRCRGDGSQRRRWPGGCKALVDCSCPRGCAADGRKVCGGSSQCLLKISFVPAKKLQTGFGSWNVAFSDVQ